MNDKEESLSRKATSQKLGKAEDFLIIRFDGWGLQFF
jgi:hypothetical protein